MNPSELPLQEQTVLLERTLLSVFMVYPETLDRIDGLRDHHFLKPEHREVFRAILALHNDGGSMEPASVLAAMDQATAYTCGTAYLYGLMAEHHNPAFLRHNLKTVRAFADMRKLNETLHEAIEDAKLQRPAIDDVSDFFDSIESRIFAIRRDVVMATADTSVEAGMPQYVAQLQRGVAGGHKTGLIDIDERLGGLRGGEMLVIGARTSEGKSSLALQIALNLARSDLRVIYFSLEMRPEELLKNVIANEARYNSKLIEDDIKDARKNAKLLEAASAVRHQQIVFPDCSRGLTIATLRSRARREAAERGLHAVFVDYLQLMSNEESKDRWQEVSAISRGLSLLADELNVPVIAAAQLNRSATKRGEEPELHHLRESGSIEQDADAVLLQWLREGDEGQENVTLMCKLAKNRGGPCGRFTLTWRKAEHRILNWAPEGVAIYP